jgi:hypothetical protein
VTDGSDEIPVTASTRIVRGTSAVGSLRFVRFVRVVRVVLVVLVVLVDAALAGVGVYLIQKWRSEPRGPGLPVAQVGPTSPSGPSVSSGPSGPSGSAAPAIAAAPVRVAADAGVAAVSAPPTPHPPAAPPVPVGVNPRREPSATAPRPATPRDVLPRGKSLPSKPSDPGVMTNPHAGSEASAPAVAAAEPPASEPVTPSTAGAATPTEPAADAADAPPAQEPPEERPLVEQMTAGIRHVVDEHRDRIIECYRRAAKSSTAKDPLRGRLEVHLRILPAGDADDVRVVQNQTGSTELGECLVAMMQSWRYPGPGAEAMEFVWPFTFRGQR